MSIVYGQYSIPFKRYKSQEVGFEDHYTDDVTIQVVQNSISLILQDSLGSQCTFSVLTTKKSTQVQRIY